MVTKEVAQQNQRNQQAVNEAAKGNQDRQLDNRKNMSRQVIIKR